MLEDGHQGRGYHEHHRPEVEEVLEGDDPVALQDHVEDVAHEVAGRLADRIARGSVADILALQHCQCPTVDGDVLCRGQEVQEEEHARQGEHVGRVRVQIEVDVLRQEEHRDPDAVLDRDQPGFSSAETLDEQRVNNWRPEKLHRERPVGKTELGLLFVADMFVG